MPNMTKGQVAELIEQVKVLIIKAHTDYAIVKTIMAKHDIGDRQARTYVSRAHSEILSETKVEVEHERKKAIRRYNYLIERCISKEQYKSAAIIQEKLDKLTGAAVETVKHEHSGQVGVSGGLAMTWNETKTFEQPTHTEE